MIARTMRRTALVASGMLIAAACTSGHVTAPSEVSGVRVTLGRSAYAPGDSVRGQVTNTTGVPESFPYLFCPTELQRQLVGVWVSVSSPDQVCPSALITMSGGASTAFAYPLPARLAPGQYRLLIPAPQPPGVKTYPAVSTPTFTVGSAAP
jgi:hypothetical protein